jgi:hypothetical protein
LKAATQAWRAVCRLIGSDSLYRLFGLSKLESAKRYSEVNAI